MKLEFSAAKALETISIFQGEAYERLKRSLLALMLQQKDELFEQSRDPDGNAWAPLSKRATERKQAKADKLSSSETNTTWTEHKILVDTGALQNSLSINENSSSVQSTEGNEVSLGSNLPYAARQNYGFSVEHSGPFRVEESRPVRQVQPARTFMGFGAKDEEQVQEKIVAHIDKNGAA